MNDDTKTFAEILNLIRQNKHLQGSLFEDFFTILAKGDFKDCNVKKKPNEKIVCEMDIVEKGLVSQIAFYQEQMARDKERIRFDQESGQSLPNPKDLDGIAKLIGRTNIVQDIIAYYTGERLFCGETFYVNFRQGFLIVQKPPEIDPEELGVKKISISELLSILDSTTSSGFAEDSDMIAEKKYFDS